MQSPDSDERPDRILAKSLIIQFHLNAPFFFFFFWPTSPFHSVDILVWMKSRPRASHEKPLHADRKEIYYSDCPVGERCPVPCLGRINEPLREEGERDEDER